MDSFSLSPSLLDIICLLEHKDVLNCTRVNRRLNEVIRRNGHILPRPETDLRMCTSNEKFVKDTKHLRFQFESAAFYLTQNRIRLRRCLNLALREMIKATLTPCLHPATIEEESIFYYAETSWQSFLENDVEDPVVVDFQCASMEDGMIQLLTFAFERYYFKKIYILVEGTLFFGRWSLPDGWYDIIRELFLRSRTKCSELQLGRAAKEAAILYENIGCQYIQITSLDCSIEDFIQAGRYWSRPMTVNLNFYSPRTMRSLVDIQDQWKLGTWHMMGLYFQEFNCHLWSREELVQLLNPRPLLVRNTEGIEGSENVEMFIDRPGDDFVLCISYVCFPRDCKEMMMYDVRTEDLNSLQFDYGRFSVREYARDMDDVTANRVTGYFDYKSMRESKQKNHYTNYM